MDSTKGNHGAEHSAPELGDAARRSEVLGWLEVATHRLCDEAKQRVYQEIVNHYAEVKSERLDAGDDEHAAHAAALAGLGDASKAARSFRKTYITVSEQRFLEYLKNPAMANAYARQGMMIIVLALNIFLVLTSIVGMFYALPGHRVYPIGVAICGMAALLWTLGNPPFLGKLVRSRASRSLLTVYSVYLLLPATGMFIWACFLPLPERLPFMLFTFTMLTVLFAVYLRLLHPLWRKLD